VLETTVHPARDSEGFRAPYDLIPTMNHGRHDPGIDFAQDFHVFALDWVRDRPIWLLDGSPIRQMAFHWAGPPAHLLVTNQIGMNLRGVDLTGMTATESNWDFTLDYLRVWRRV
jgi:beta-glucanase (GH16 family)